MSYVIEINKVVDGALEFVVGCEFKSRRKAEQVFSRSDNEYQVEPNNVDDFLVDLHLGDDLVSTFVTDEKGVKAIDNKYFKEETT